MPGRCAVKADGLLPFDVRGHGLLIQNVQHAVSGRKCVLQGAAQRSQRDHRAKGGKQRDGGNQHTRIADLPGPIQGCAGQEHGQIKSQNRRARNGVVPPGDALHPRFRLRECIRARVHLRKAFGALAVLLRFAQAAQAVQHKRAQLARLGAENQPAVTAAAGYRQRNHNAHHGVSGQGKQPQHPVKGADEQAHDHGKQRRDGQGGKGMRVKDLQQLDVRGDHGDQVSLVPSLQLGGCEPAQRAEHPVAQNRQQLKGDEVVAGLLPIAQQGPHQREHHHTGKQHIQRNRRALPQNVQHRIAAQNGDERRAQVTGQPHGNGQQHIAHHRPDQNHQPRHHGPSTASFHWASPSFP